MGALLLYIFDLVSMPIVVYKSLFTDLRQLNHYVSRHEDLAPNWRLKHPTYLLMKWILKQRNKS